VTHGGPAVDVSVEPLDEGFAVADTGPGVPVDKRDEVFEAGVSTGDGTTGLGLSIVTDIAAAHGWEVALTESQSGGAQFEFKL
jgi:signal transduction histidine kinase